MPEGYWAHALTGYDLLNLLEENLSLEARLSKAESLVETMGETVDRLTRDMSEADERYLQISRVNNEYKEYKAACEQKDELITKMEV